MDFWRPLALQLKCRNALFVLMVSSVLMQRISESSISIIKAFLLSLCLTIKPLTLQNQELHLYPGLPPQLAVTRTTIPQFLLSKRRCFDQPDSRTPTFYSSIKTCAVLNAGLSPK
ncbi:hypothetical protein CPB83DRAFT_941997 [Crepidotus variabilis]|uniref:Uncharacterized protein n=1 Tax=Crepidotus variabilis TaxID=179855 RepID=A0A9P6JLR5_9AGAR|nr:hypothetical protein CPB83DRAFT_941997 [Crepidotus variabilis]